MEEIKMGTFHWILLALFVAALSFLSTRSGTGVSPLMPAVKIPEALRPAPKAPEAPPAATEAVQNSEAPAPEGAASGEAVLADPAAVPAEASEKPVEAQH